MTKGIFKRLVTWLGLDPADWLEDGSDPPDQAAPILAEMASGLEQAKDAVSTAVVKQHQLEQRLAEALTRCAEWDAKTDAALQSGDEERARFALKRQAAYHHQAADLQAALDRQQQVVAEMRASLRALQANVEDAGSYEHK